MILKNRVGPNGVNLRKKNAEYANFQSPFAPLRALYVFFVLFPPFPRKLKSRWASISRPPLHSGLSKVFREPERIEGN
jgi:hypothetical protein